MGKYLGWLIFFCGWVIIVLTLFGKEFNIQDAIFGFITQILGLAYVIEYKVSLILERLENASPNKETTPKRSNPNLR